MMKERLAKLIDLKSIITISIVVTLCILVFMGRVTTEQFMPIVTLIVSFYFAYKKEGAI